VWRRSSAKKGTTLSEIVGKKRSREIYRIINRHPHAFAFHVAERGKAAAQFKGQATFGFPSSGMVPIRAPSGRRTRFRQASIAPG